MAKDAPTLDRLSSINADGSRKGIQTADVKGPWMTRRRIVFAVLILIYVSLPFIQVAGHPAVQLDIETRHFYLFGTTFNAQDFWRFVFVLLAIGTTLFFVTAWLGRAWCGWACPQTVFLEGVFRPIERFWEGPREARMRRNAGPWTFEKFRVKAGSHVTYFLMSLILAHVMLAFFVSIPKAFDMVRGNPREHWTAFVWVMAFTSVTYFVMAWFREQVCVVICPYGRLQSVMLDRESLIIGYDVKRGEPRGHLTKAAKEAPRTVSLPVVSAAVAARAEAEKELGFDENRRGDCIDCMKCVNVCPTGIDIRNGLQLECVACTQCADACDEVMVKIGKPKGLVRYDSLNGLETGKRRMLRPRLFAYAALVSLAFTALAFATTTRSAFEANLIRGKGLPYVLENGAVRNQLELHLVNKTDQPATFKVVVEGQPGMRTTLPMDSVTVEGQAHYRLPLFVFVDDADYKKPFDVHVAIDAGPLGHRDLSANFAGPLRLAPHHDGEKKDDDRTHEGKTDGEEKEHREEGTAGDGTAGDGHH